MAILALLYPCISLCLMLRCSTVNFEHTHIAIDCSKLLWVVISILHVAISTRWNPVVSFLRRLAPVHSGRFGFIQTTMNRSVVHCPFIVIDTHMTEPASGRLPSFSRAKYVPCVTTIAPVFCNSVTLSTTNRTLNCLSVFPFYTKTPSDFQVSMRAPLPILHNCWSLNGMTKNTLFILKNT